MMLLLLCCLSFLSIVDIPSSPVFKIPLSLQCFYLFFTSVFKGLLLLTLLSPLSGCKTGRIISGAVIALFALMSLTNALSFIFYGFGISRKLILIFAQTTVNEASGFIPGLWHNLLALFSSLKFFLAFFSVGIICVAVRYLRSVVIGYMACIFGFIGFVLFIIFSFSFSSGRSAHLLSARLFKYCKEVYEWNEEYQKLKECTRSLPYKNSVASLHLAKTVIVVIGESAVRGHHSIYGYPLPTSPFMRSHADSLIIFTDVIGSSNSTAGNMERILSFKEDDATYGDGMQYPLLIDLFNEMDYKTFWLSNQERTGTVSNTSGVMTMNADVIRYVGADNSEDVLTVKYDDALLAPLDEALADSAVNKLIFLHLIGSHVDYKSRYPDEFEHFSAKDEIETFRYKWLDGKMAGRRAEYDNSIRFTDHILGCVVGLIQKEHNPALMIYFSDHGENVYDTGPYNVRDANSVQVPFFVYPNIAYSSSYHNLIERLKRAKNKPLSTANFVHLLISLTGGQYRCYEPRLDISSNSYEVRPRYVDEEIWDVIPMP